MQVCVDTCKYDGYDEGANRNFTQKDPHKEELRHAQAFSGLQYTLIRLVVLLIGNLLSRMIAYFFFQNASTVANINSC